MTTLQWGRDLIVAETPAACEQADFFHVRLQWGRDLIVAETAVALCFPSVGKDGFNGAAT